MRAFFLTAALVFAALAAMPAAGFSRAFARSAAPSVSSAAIIHIHDFTFDPDTVTVSPGATVEWDNDDGARHTITAADGSFDSGNLKPGQKWSHTFTTAGIVAYGCTEHPEMSATVVVK